VIRRPTSRRRQAFTVIGRADRIGADGGPRREQANGTFKAGRIRRLAVQRCGRRQAGATILRRCPCGDHIRCNGFMATLPVAILRIRRGSWLLPSLAGVTNANRDEILRVGESRLIRVAVKRDGTLLRTFRPMVFESIARNGMGLRFIFWTAFMEIRVDDRAIRVATTKVLIWLGNNVVVDPCRRTRAEESKHDQVCRTGLSRKPHPFLLHECRRLPNGLPLTRGRAAPVAFNALLNEAAGAAVSDLARGCARADHRLRLTM